MKSHLIVASIGLLLGFTGGWVLHKTACPAIRAVQDPRVAILAALLNKARAHDDSVTAASQRMLNANGAYRDSLARLTRKERDDSARLAAATTPRDSAARCSVVVLDCERRAELAIQRAADLQTALAAQAKLASRRCGAFVGIVPVRVDYPFKPHVGASVGALIGCQLW